MSLLRAAASSRARGSHFGRSAGGGTYRRDPIGGMRRAIARTEEALLYATGDTHRRLQAELSTFRARLVSLQAAV